jgi:hypothetical protein
MPFIFKGGTSLLVMLDEPRRLSTDIDIIVDHNTDVDGYIEKAGKIFPFVSVEEHKRKGANDIEKRHFRFYFLSPRTGKEINILLDVVLEDNPYLKVMERPIRSSLLLSEGEDLTVNLPDKNCILGDKLTAFAPHTIGIPFGVDKELEIIKQMFEEIYTKLLLDLTSGNTLSPIYNHHIEYINKPYYKRDMPYIETEKNQIVVDYIASMTDDYFIELHKYLFPSSTLELKYKGYFK